MPDGRFAPSPTGELHLGSLRTALVAWLFARADGGRFLMRMEDLDTGRVRPEHYEGQLRDLAALGLDWDEPVVRQSERLERYDAAFERLRRAGLVYPCFCTRAEIRAAASAPHGPLPDGAYPGTCRALAPERRTALAAERPPAWRVAADLARVGFEDLLHGSVVGLVDDFVVRRNDGVFAYQLAVMVDDADQGIELVVRGDDLLDSTPRQLWLADALGLPAPRYAHVALVLAHNNARLAKRHGAVTLADRVALGERPADVLAMLASSLGLAEPGEPVAARQLLERFDPARLPRAPWVFPPAAASPG